MDTTQTLVLLVTGVGMILAHRPADYFVQTDHQAQHKGMTGPESWCGRWNAFKHAVTYSATQFAVVAAFLAVCGFTGSWAVVAGGVVLNGITHYIIDRRWTLEWFARNVARKGSWIASDPGALPHMDQAAHYTLFAPIAVGIALLA